MATLEQLQIPDVISSIDAEMKKLKRVETASSLFKTGMKLGPFGDLKQTKDVETLVKAYSYVMKKGEAYEQAAKDLGLKEVKPFTEEGNSVVEWKADINLQIEVITYSQRLAELKELKKEAEQFISQEDKKKMFLQKLISSVSK